MTIKLSSALPQKSDKKVLLQEDITNIPEISIQNPCKRYWKSFLRYVFHCCSGKEKARYTGDYPKTCFIIEQKQDSQYNSSENSASSVNTS